MDEARRKEIQARRAGITPAPWHDMPLDVGHRVNHDITGGDSGSFLVGRTYDDADAVFIAAAPTDIDDLLTALSVAESRIQELEAHVGRLSAFVLAWRSPILDIARERGIESSSNVSALLGEIDSLLSSTPAESLERLRNVRSVIRRALTAQVGDRLQCRGCYAYLDGADRHTEECWAAPALSALDAEEKN